MSLYQTEERVRELGNLFIASGPTMVGKGTACTGLLKKVAEERERFPDKRRPLAFSVSHTTRAARPGEVHGVDYYFVTAPEFEGMIDRGEFLEYAKVHGQYYGTSLPSTLELLRSGHDILLDIDVQGRDKILCSGFAERHRVRIFSAMIIPPTLDLLRVRLEGSDRNDIERRLAAAQAEIDQWPRYGACIINFVGCINTTVGVLHEVFYQD